MQHMMALLLILAARSAAVAANRSTKAPLRALPGLNGAWTEIRGTSCDGEKIKDFGNVTLELAEAECTQNSACGCITVERLPGRHALHVGVAVVPRSYHWDAYISDARTAAPSQARASWITSAVTRALLCGTRRPVQHPSRRNHAPIATLTVATMCVQV